jgi:Icc-related predicted phosphoesterase
VKIQYFSDLHLEFGALPYVSTDADVVIAAGDIGVGLDGIRWLTRIDRPVIYVLGNHEYWGQDYTDFIDSVWQNSSGTNIHFLENESVIIDGVRFVGCSLWTDYGHANEQIMNAAAKGMNDFRYITDGDKPLEPSRLLQAHRQSVDWLREILSEPFSGQTVVVTHHAPSMKSWHRSPMDGYQYCYCSNLEPIMRRTEAELWVHGHTHSGQDYQIHGVRVVCNPRGYFNHEEVKGFQLDKIIEI